MTGRVRTGCPNWRPAQGENTVTSEEGSPPAKHTTPGFGGGKRTKRRSPGTPTCRTTAASVHAWHNQRPDQPIWGVKAMICTESAGTPIGGSVRVAMPSIDHAA